jgi:hypothetical protein
MSVLSEITSVVAAALRADGRAEAATDVLTGRVGRCTYSESTNVGYIYIEQVVPVHHGESTVYETVCFASPHWFNVDIRGSGRVFGIELMSPPKSFADYALSVS